jgi:hypothetical protein
MSSTRFANVTIAGVEIRRPGGEFTRCQILDAEALKGELAGSNTVALDSTVHLQLTVREARAVRFGVRAAQMPASVLDAVVLAIETALLAGDAFPVVGADDSGVDDFDVQAFPDFEALGNSGRLFTRGENISGGFVREVVFRFITTEATPTEE